MSSVTPTEPSPTPADAAAPTPVPAPPLEPASRPTSLDSLSLADRRRGCLWGPFVADALAMPVHWYYDNQALVRDYGFMCDYADARNPHPDSILWRTLYRPLNSRGDILHDQASFYGQADIHYHQNLKAGDNTINLLLAAELIESLAASRHYDKAAYLTRYLEFFLTAGRHADTYIEQAHREFFINYAAGEDPEQCGVRDRHVGGLAAVPALVAVLCDAPDKAKRAVREHVSLTHRSEEMILTADLLADLILALLRGAPLQAEIAKACVDPRRPWHPLEYDFEKWRDLPDNQVIGGLLSSACYIDDAFAAICYIAWKHGTNFEQAICVNTNAGGDNCHRGAVLGGLLGAALGFPNIPSRWIEGLRARTRLADPINTLTAPAA